MKDRIWLSPPHMSGNEMELVKSVFDSNWIAPLGPQVDGFEKDLCYVTGCAHAAVLSSGTAALHLALIILGVEKGDEVICPSFTFSASANPIVYLGATPVFVDSEITSWNMDPELMRSAIQERIKKGKKIKAIIAVHLYGMPAQMNLIMDIAEQYSIPVIEDAAESLGSKYDGKSTGSFGVMSILSFNGNKIITTSGGGALISDNKDYIEKSRFLSTQARDDAPHYQHSQIGYNYRLSNVLAAIGRAQLNVLDGRVKSRRANFKYYYEQLKSVPGFNFLAEPEKCFSNRWLSCLLIDPEHSPGKITREDIRLALQKENIETRPLWKPLHLQPIFSGFPFYGSGVSEQLFADGLCLPSGSSLTIGDKERIIQAIKSAL